MTTDTAAETIAAVAEKVDLEDTSVASESSKTLLTAAASTAAVVVGAFVLARAYEKVSQIRADRAAKKAEEQVHVVTDTPAPEKIKKN